MNTTLDERVLELAKRYLADADRCCSALARRLGRQDLLRAVIEKQLPRVGELEPGLIHRFHGIGCAFEGVDIDVDVDFPEDGRWDAFDAWRLHRYAAGHRDFASLDEKTIVAALARLEASGDIDVDPALPRMRRLRSARRAS